ncbi:MAG: hypothetical protein NC934_02335 [Candidatus Omnitrophica bacterium]|nr:hypothetical protein [Candidatus Omnitrophota bacterium]MCM8809002.1 hypothetical protein [Candidatus Omnitrophota bacterium]
MRKFILKIVIEYIFLILFGLFIFIFTISNFNSAKIIRENFWMFFTEILTFFPFIFLLGLFYIWLPKEKIEKHICLFIMEKGMQYKKSFYLDAFSTLKISILTFEIGLFGIKFSLLTRLLLFLCLF